jgi:hypothetical protein
MKKFILVLLCLWFLFCAIISVAIERSPNMGFNETFVRMSATVGVVYIFLTIAKSMK